MEDPDGDGKVDHLVGRRGGQEQGQVQGQEEREYTVNGSIGFDP